MGLNKRRSHWSTNPDLRSYSDEMNEVDRCKAQFKDYASQTTIHGIKYTCESGRNVYEKFIWILLCIGSAALCFFLIQPVVQKFIDSPTITTVASTNFPIWNIDFPAVTICSNIKVANSNFQKLRKKSP